MKELIGKKLGPVEFIEKDGEMFGRVRTCGVTADYLLAPVHSKRPLEAIMTDLDGTTLYSEEFWMYVIERTVKKMLKNDKFSFCDDDVPFVSGYSTADHLGYCIEKYAQGYDLMQALSLYHSIAEEELSLIMKGEGRTDAFHPADGLKEFLTEVKRRKIKIGLVTSGADYKAIPEITAVFRTLGMGDPLKFYDAIITGGTRNGTGNYGTMGEVAAKPHPWVYTELAYMGLKISRPENVLGIEDSAAGVMALRFAGFPAVGVNRGNIKQSGLDSLCEKKVNALSEVLELI